MNDRQIEEENSHETSAELDEEKAISGDGAQTPDLESPEENRSTTRINLDRPLLIRLSDGDTVRARLVNLSCGGLAFNYPSAAKKGIKLTLLFQINTEAGIVNIQAEGTTRHSHIKHESFVTGIQFTRISEEDLDVIEEFIEFKVSGASQMTGLTISHRHKD